MSADLPPTEQSGVGAALWLLSDEAAAHAESIGARPITPAVLQALRRAIGGPEAATRGAALVELADLRRRGVAKFSRAAAMFFTRKGLEQATDEAVARYKAQRFATLQGIVDACCGIGGDLVSLATYGAVGIDADPVIAAYARRNAAVHGQEVSVSTQRLDSANLPDCAAWHADPDRRSDGRRTTRPELHDPSLSTLEAWRRQTPSAAVKLAPATELSEAWQAECELEWVSRGGECRQQVAWCGPLASAPGQRRATRLTRQGEQATLLGAPRQAVEVATRRGDYVYDPDPAVLASDLLGALAHQEQLAAVAPRGAYLTGDRPAPSPLLDTFRVIDEMPLRPKALAAWLGQRQVGRLEIKCRSGAVSPEALRRQLRPRGDGEATLLVYAEGRGALRVILAERVR